MERGALKGHGALLLGFYLRTKGVARIFILLFMGAYCVIEGIFLAANLSKFLAGGWITSSMMILSTTSKY